MRLVCAFFLLVKLKLAFATRSGGDGCPLDLLNPVICNFLSNLEARGVQTPKNDDHHIVTVRASAVSFYETLERILEEASSDTWLPDFITIVLPDSMKHVTGDSPHAQAHLLGDYLYGVPISCVTMPTVVNTVLSQGRDKHGRPNQPRCDAEKLAASLSDKAIEKLGGTARVTLAHSADPRDCFRRTLHPNLRPTSLLIGIYVKLSEGYDTGKIPSVVAVSASDAAHDRKWSATREVEMIRDAPAMLGQAFRDVLEQAIHDAFVPTDVIAYRMGAGLRCERISTPILVLRVDMSARLFHNSESTMKTVLSDEALQLTNILRDVGGGAQPRARVLFVVCTTPKLKLSPTASTGFDCKGSMNVKPGFVADSGLTDSMAHDYFSLPYPGIQGTSSPIYHRILANECAIHPLDIQDITLALHFA